MVNGADRLCDVLLANGIDVCFANPGTSEMHFVAALDRKPQMRCILGLFEGVVTGAADGYARMTGKPASTLLHLGPGLANGLANLHNARRARTPIVNIVGDHATYHLQHDAPLTSDIESLARPMSHWFGRASGPADVQNCVEQAYIHAMTAPGIATMALPADAAWGAMDENRPIEPVRLPEPPRVADEDIRAAAKALRGSRNGALMLGGRALRADVLAWAGRIARSLGVRLIAESSPRVEQGAGRVAPELIPYRVDDAVRMLAPFEDIVSIGGRDPVAFFAYPGKPSSLLPQGCDFVALARAEHDFLDTIERLADELGVTSAAPCVTGERREPDLSLLDGPLNPDAISVAVIRHLPENAIVCNETVTSAGQFSRFAPLAAPHDLLQSTGGSIGIGIPLATGAAVACPDRKVITLQADGSGMYTVQGLWTQARERLDVLTIVFSNRRYAILQGEMRNVGVNDFGANAQRMLEIVDPDIDWCGLARSMGVEAVRADTVAGFVDALQAGLRMRGPFLIEAVI
jgi:acetolactate synthase-1/2/3 large subunit